MPTIFFTATDAVAKATGMEKKHLEQMMKIASFVKAIHEQGNLKTIHYDEFSDEGMTLTIELKCGTKHSVLITHEMTDAKKWAMEYYMRRAVVRDNIPTLKFLADYSLCMLLAELATLGLLNDGGNQGSPPGR